MPGLCYVSPEVVRNTPARVLLRSYTRVAAKLISIRRLHRVLPLVRNSTERLHAVLVLISLASAVCRPSVDETLRG